MALPRLATGLRVEAPVIPDASPPARASTALALRLVRALGPLVFFTAATVLMTWPLATDLSRHIIMGITADADVSRWDLWWLKTALLDRHSDPFYTDMLYYPYRQGSDPLPLFFHTLQPLNGLLALPILLTNDATVGPTLAYNSLALAHFILSGLAMYWLARELTGSVAAGLVAGVLFTFGPFHQYHLHEAQLELIPIECFPLFTLFLWRLLPGAGGRRARLGAGLGATLCLVATTFTSWYWTLYLLLLGGLLALALLAADRGAWRRVAGGLVAVVAAWGVLVLPFLLPTLRAAADPTFQLVSGLDYEVRFSLSPLELVTAAKDTRMDPAVWFMGPLGYSALALAAVGLARLRRRALFWGLLIVAGATLALGPYLKWSDATDVAHTTGIPLPYLLVRNLPFVSIARVPRRFIVLADLGIDMLAGFGAAYALAWLRRAAGARRAALGRVAPALGAVVLIAVPLLEFAVIPQPVQPVAFSPFFTRVAQEPGDFGILELPVTSHYLRDHVRMLNQTVHQKKIIGGYLARRVEDYYLDRASPFYQFIDLPVAPPPDITPPPAPFAVLNYYDIPYVVVYKEDESYAQPGDREAVLAYAHALFPDPAAVVQDDAQVTAYRVPRVAPVRTAWVGSGWQPPETQGGRTWRWSSGQDAAIQILTATPIGWPLQFTSAAFHGAAHLSVTLNGAPVRTIDLGPDLRAYDLGVIALPAGESTLAFHSDAPARSPIDVGESQRDARPLGFLLSDLRAP
jgi:hypothetical protein